MKSKKRSPTRSLPTAAPSPTTTRSAATTGPGTTGNAPQPFAGALRAMKTALDPGGIMNPGVLIDVRG